MGNIINWEELKEESENLIKKDGFVAIEKDEWEWIVNKIESLALENVMLKDELEAERNPFKDMDKWAKVWASTEREKMKMEKKKKKEIR